MRGGSRKGAGRKPTVPMSPEELEIRAAAEARKRKREQEDEEAAEKIRQLRFKEEQEKKKEDLRKLEARDRKINNNQTTATHVFSFQTWVSYAIRNSLV